MTVPENAAKLARRKVQDALPIRVNQETALATYNDAVHERLQHQQVSTIALPCGQIGRSRLRFQAYFTVTGSRRVVRVRRIKISRSCRVARPSINTPGIGSPR